MATSASVLLYCTEFDLSMKKMAETNISFAPSQSVHGRAGMGLVSNFRSIYHGSVDTKEFQPCDASDF